VNQAILMFVAYVIYLINKSYKVPILNVTMQLIYFWVLLFTAKHTVLKVTRIVFSRWISSLVEVHMLKKRERSDVFHNYYFCKITHNYYLVHGPDW